MPYGLMKNREITIGKLEPLRGNLYRRSMLRLYSLFFIF